MPDYLTPGVYIKETSSRPEPITGVTTSTAGFVGLAERGPEAPHLITSWTEYRRLYGGFIPDKSFLAYAVAGVFANGGQRCFISRVVAKDAKRAYCVLGRALTVAAIGRGLAGNEISVSVAPATQAGLQKITVKYQDILESYDDLTHAQGAAHNLVRVINGTSKLVRVWWSGEASRLPENPHDPERPGHTLATSLTGADLDENTAADLDVFVGYEAAVPVALGSGNQGAGENNDDRSMALSSASDEVFGMSNGLKGLASLDEISLLVIPDQADAARFPENALTEKVIDQCERLKDRFAIISSEKGDADNINDLQTPSDSVYAACYFPWIEMADPTTRGIRLVPACGHIAGIYARTDIERGVHEAPANKILQGAVGLQTLVDDHLHAVLERRRFNSLRDFRASGRGLCLWGALTLSSDPEWKYISVSRLYMFVEASISKGLHWVVFKSNNEATWASVRQSVTNFLDQVWRSGALAGLTGEEAYFVTCDRSTMTEDDIDNGRLICVIGIAPIKPAEFVVFQIGQKTADSRV